MIRHICMFALQDEDHDNVVAQALQLGEPLKTLPQAVKGEVVTKKEQLYCSRFMKLF